MASRFDDLARPPLDAAHLRHALVTPDSMWTRLDVVEETASTNADLAADADSPGASGRVLIAEHQTAGRGRLNRTWKAPPRAGLTFSVLIRPTEVADERWPWIPLIAGLAVAAAVQRIAAVPAALKWPNDVVVDDRKLAGVLVERVHTSHTPAAVIGIGLNVSLRKAELPVPEATSLALEDAATTDRSVLMRAVLRNLEGLLRHWQSRRGDPDEGLRASYVEACSTLDRDVSVELPGEGLMTGRAEGIDANGRLLVRAADGQHAVGAGDVLHLRSGT